MWRREIALSGHTRLLALQLVPLEHCRKQPEIRETNF
jgi:hypothetical protein